jgi:DNA-binding transcriptional regulator YdaS (Cro superfamily)
MEGLAARLGTSEGNLCRIETGRQKISDLLLPKLEAVTGVPARLLRPDLAKLDWGQRRSRRRLSSAA